MKNFEKIIVKNLFNNDKYAKEVSPFLSDKYAEDPVVGKIYGLFNKHITKYHSFPSMDEFVLTSIHDKEYSDKDSDDFMSYLDDVKKVEHDPFNHKSLVDLTEEHFKLTHMTSVVYKGVELLANKDKKNEKNMLPEMFRDALKLSFKNTVGIEYLTEESIDNQFDYYHTKEEKVSFHKHKTLNKKTNGGFGRKTVNLILGGTGVGKTLWLVDLGSDNCIYR